MYFVVAHTPHRFTMSHTSRLFRRDVKELEEVGIEYDRVERLVTT